jgi:excisionase family DNA binding protein
MIADYHPDSLPDRLKEFILSHDLTLHEAASILKISAPTLWRFIKRKGIKKHHDRTVYKIKKLIGEK